jgi:hypothetical protein
MNPNPSVPGYRFRKEVFKADKKTSKKFQKNKIEVVQTDNCSICKQEYTGYVKIKLTSKGLVCIHERPSLCEDPHLTAGEQKRIASRLAPNEIAVKGGDGIIRILEK